MCNNILVLLLLCLPLAYVLTIGVIGFAYIVYIIYEWIAERIRK